MTRPIIPIRAGDPATGPPPYGGLGLDFWVHGATFLEYVEAAGAQRAAIEAAFRAVELPADLQAYFTGCRRRGRVAALASFEAPDAPFVLAHAERLLTLTAGLWMRIFLVERAADVHQRLAPGRPLPHLVFFGEDRREVGRWGPRPQRLEDELRRLGPEARAAHAARFYAASRGVDLARELRAVLETPPAAEPEPPRRDRGTG